MITINAAIALGLRTGSAHFDWGLLLPFLATVTVGVLGGSIVANRFDADRLTRSFAVMLLLVGAHTAASTLL